MKNLAHWQASLAGVIDADAPVPIASQSVLAVPGPSIEQGSAVYRNNSRGARVDALAAVYPVCRRLLGEQSFFGLAREFVRRGASRDSDLNRFGEGFSRFVAQAVAEQPPFAHLVWLPDLVELEWLCHAVYYRDDDPPLDLAPLGSHDPADLHPRPASAVGWLHSAWPIHEIWEAHQACAEPAGLNLRRGDWHLVIERRDLRVRVSTVDSALWNLLDACGRGLSLAEMAADPRLDVAGLGGLVGRQWIGAVETPTDAV